MTARTSFKAQGSHLCLMGYTEHWPAQQKTERLKETLNCVDLLVLEVTQTHRGDSGDDKSLPDMLFTEHWLFFFLFGTSGHLGEGRGGRQGVGERKKSNVIM